MMSPPEIFSRSARRNIFARAASFPESDRWLLARTGSELIDRAFENGSKFKRALVLGSSTGISARLTDHGIESVRTSAASLPDIDVQCEEDQLPFPQASFDLVIANGGLDTVNDLPGALILIRRLLRPNGLFLGAMSGAGSLPRLRQALAATMQDDRTIARLHPAVDVRDAGDLLARAGFQMPVAEAETITARYRDPSRFFSDLRANGLTNVLLHRAPMTRRDYRKLCAALNPLPFEEEFVAVYLTGHAPLQ